MKINTKNFNKNKPTSINFEGGLRSVLCNSFIIDNRQLSKLYNSLNPAPPAVFGHNTMARQARACKGIK